jgi:hypothetical protein
MSTREHNTHSYEATTVISPDGSTERVSTIAPEVQAALGKRRATATLYGPYGSSVVDKSEKLFRYASMVKIPFKGLALLDRMFINMTLRGQIEYDTVRTERTVQGKHVQTTCFWLGSLDR